MNKKILGQLILALVMVLATAGLRLVPHMPNVAPVAAVALAAGAWLPISWAWLVPVLAMGASDAVIGGYDWKIMTAVYGSFAVMAVWGLWLKKKQPARILLAAVGSSVLFYLVTNLAVWRFSGMYEQSWSGLMLSYEYALPFFRVNLLGNLAYTAGLFGAVEVVAWLRVKVAGSSRVINYKLNRTSSSADKA